MSKALFIMEENTFELVYPSHVRDELSQISDIIAPLHTRESIEQSPELLEEVEVIFSGWGGPILNHDLLLKAPKLKAFFYAAGSIKGIVTQEAWERGILFSTATAANAIPVAEYTISQILFGLKNGWFYVRNVQNNKAFPPKPYPVPGVFKSTVGLIALSSVGIRVAELLKMFDIRVLAYDPYASKSQADLLNVELCSLEDIFTYSDVVSLHAPLLEETTEMIKGEHFARMKANSVFINTSRGSIVDEEEMIDTLQKRTDITGILDVTNPEPPLKESPLYEMENIVLTPHLAGSEGEECGRMGELMLEEFKRYKSGEELKGRVYQEQMRGMA